MKKIEAIIRPEKLDEIKDALNKINVKGLTISQVMGCGNQKGQINVYRGTAVEITLLSKIKVEIVCEDENLSNIVEIITKFAKTGKIGDGKIFIYSIDDVVRIRTGETGDDAI